MAMLRSFRDLTAWQKGMELAAAVYESTKRMPSDERFGLTSQVRRAVVSIPSNIAEGYGRQTRPDCLKHLRIARGSLAELATQFELIFTMRMLPTDQAIPTLIDQEERILYALIRSLEQKTKKEHRPTRPQ